MPYSQVFKQLHWMTTAAMKQQRHGWLSRVKLAMARLTVVKRCCASEFLPTLVGSKKAVHPLYTFIKLPDIYVKGLCIPVVNNTYRSIIGGLCYATKQTKLVLRNYFVIVTLITDKEVMALLSEIKCIRQPNRKLAYNHDPTYSKHLNICRAMLVLLCSSTT